MTMYDEKDWNDDVTILDDDGFSFLYSFECQNYFNVYSIVQNEQKTENKNEKKRKKREKREPYVKWFFASTWA